MAGIIFCQSCRGLLQAVGTMLKDQSDKSSQEHYPNPQVFVDSAAAGCKLCQFFLKQLSSQSLKDVMTGTWGSLSSLRLKKEIVNIKGTFMAGFKEGELRLHHYQATLVKLNGPLPVYAPAQDLTAYASITRGIFMKWMLDCTRDHKHSQRSKKSRRPLFARILYIGSDTAETHVKLVEAKDVPDYPDYLTLSHCWGALDILKLSLANYEEFENDISVDDLPKTFTDAIEFARSIYFKYLWIDSLCIIQDSPQDWNQQASVMGNIYQGAICNLAATGAVDGRAGFYSQRNPELLRPFALSGTYLQGASEDPPQKLTDEYMLIDPTIWTRDVTNSPLGRRAWVVQERLLAPRVLHFGSRQLFWECAELRACEELPAGFGRFESLAETATFKTHDPTNPEFDFLNEAWDGKGGFLSRWYHIVELYTSAKLTRSTDKLVAIRGLANTIAAPTKYQYLAGLWNIQLPFQLIWKIFDPAPRPPTYRAPSWSWASVDGTACGSWFRFQFRASELLEIIDIKVPKREFLGIGPLECFSLKVRGRLIPCTAHHTIPHIGRVIDDILPSRNLEIRFGDTAVNGYKDVDSEDLSEPLFCMPVLEFTDMHGVVTGLVLQHTGVKGVFRRVAQYDCIIKEKEELSFQQLFRGDLTRVKKEDGIPGSMNDELFLRACEDEKFGNLVFTII